MFSLSFALIALAATRLVVAVELSSSQTFQTKPIHPKPVKYDGTICTVTSGEDDSAASILEAVQTCNNGGTVVFEEGETYTIGSPLDLTFLENIDIAILGTIVFSDDVEYWEANSFAYAYQDVRLMWRFGGTDVNIYGNGTGLIDGNGQAWWNAYVANSSILRPVLFGADGLQSSSITDLKMYNPPNWFNLIANSSDILISGLNLTVEVTNSSSPAHNTDGWDTFRSDNIVIQDSVIVNNDDCVSFKPNSTNILIQNLDCTGSHGISVGSLGQYQGEYDIVENIYVYNTSLTNASDGARIKVWPGVAPGTTGSTSGGGSGYVKNITYELMYIDNDAYAIELTQCYGSDSQDACDEYPSEMIIEDVLFKSFSGTTSTKYDPIVGTLVCSSPDVCINIQAQDIDISPPSGDTAQWTCTNMNDTLLDINCV